MPGRIGIGMRKRRYRKNCAGGKQTAGRILSGSRILHETGRILLRILIPVLGIVARKALQRVWDRKLNHENQFTGKIENTTEKEIPYREPGEIRSDLDFNIINGKQVKR